MTTIFFAVFYGLTFARNGIIAIWKALNQTRNRRVFNRGVVDTQAVVLDLWSEKGYDSYTFYIKLSFQPISANSETNQIEVVAEINLELYKKCENASRVSIKYAKDDPLILVIEGET